jgi:rhamnosyltransferase
MAMGLQMQDDVSMVAPPRIARVCAVCVTYHPDANLPERLSTLLRQVSHLIVVDNGSSAAALRMLNEIAKDDRVTLIDCKNNLGIARGLNIGVEQAINLAHEYVLLIDQDTCVNEDLVPVLTRIYHCHPDKDRLAVVGAGYANSEPPPAMCANDSALAYEAMETVITSGSLLSLETFQHIGPFREEFFIDYVDSEYCARARNKGYLVVRAKRTLMVHSIGHAVRQRFLWMSKYTRNYPADRLYYQARNDTVMLRDSGRYRNGSWFFKSFARSFRRCKRVMLFERHKMSKIAGVLHGWCDGIRGHLGPRKSQL